MRIVKCCLRGQLLRSSVMYLSVGKSNVCKPIQVYLSPLETPCLQGATTVRSFSVVNHRATVGMRCVPGSVTLGGFLLTLMGPAPRYIRIIGLSLLVMSLISFALMFRLACVLLEKWRHVHMNKLLGDYTPSNRWECCKYVT
jgi:hypothetical protein